jgi:hypothetical protein
MKRDEFSVAVAAELKLRGATFDRGDLEEFLTDSWPLIQGNPDEAWWAAEYIDAGRATLPA